MKMLLMASGKSLMQEASEVEPSQSIELQAPKKRKGVMYLTHCLKASHHQRPLK